MYETEPPPFNPERHDPHSVDPAGASGLGDVAAIGTVILGRFRVFQSKPGSRGPVIFVTDQQTQQRYAVKTYRQETVHEQSSTNLFKSEVKTWLTLPKHTNIIQLQFVEWLDQRPLLFLEYADGEPPSLRDRLQQQGTISLSETILYLQQLCTALEFASLHGETAHLDLKPDNVLFDHNNALKLTDFGLTERIQVARGQIPRLQGGTWRYAPPERFQRQAEDSRSDVYSFGLIAYEMLTGKLPFPFELSADRAESKLQVEAFYQTEQLSALAMELGYSSATHGLDPKIAAIISGCLQPDMSQRHQNFKRIRKTLEYEFRLPPLPDPAPARIDVPTMHRQAMTLFYLGDYSEALTVLNQLLVRSPVDAQLWLDAARVAKANGQAANARQLVKQSLWLDSSLLEAQVLLKELA